MTSWEKAALYAQLPFKQLFEESRYGSGDRSYHPEAPPPTRPKAERRPIRTDSPLCNVCRSALEYYAYVVGACKAWRTSAEDLDLSEVVSHHRELYSLFDEAFSYSCHLCIFLASYMRSPENEAGMWRHVARDAQVEMSLNVDFTSYRTRNFGRLHFSTTSPKRDRSDENYRNFLRLEIWPTKDTDANSDVSWATPENDGVPLSRSSSADVSGGDNERHLPLPYSSDIDSEENMSAVREEHSPVYERHIYSDDFVSAFPKGDSTGCDLSQTLAKEWLGNCEKNEDGQHVDCNTSEGTWLPTRLLDVRHASETSVLRLVSSSDISDAFSEEEKRYITLSHCWGEWGSKEMPVLKYANHRHRHEKGISIERIPQTFRDAITVAQWFQGKIPTQKQSSVYSHVHVVRWLWIDSLCIIQDSDADWQREALLMDRVYKKGFLNISADWNADSRDGLFNPRSPMRVQPLKVELPEIGESIHLVVDERDMFDWVNTAPLSQRAWVFQERHLARWNLHFTEQEMFFECCYRAPYFASETFPNGAPRFFEQSNAPLYHAATTTLRSTIDIYELWRDLCEMYSEKKLSNPTDKSVAISGLAKEFQKLVPDDVYFSGMWWSTFPLCLGWKSQSHPIQENLLEAPSWSWTSIDGEVKFNTRIMPQSSNSPPSISGCSESELSGSKRSIVNRHQHYRFVIKIESVPLSSELLDGKQTNELIISGFLRKITLIISGTPRMLRYWNKKKLIQSMDDKKTDLFLHDGDQKYEHEDAEVELDLDTGEIPDTVNGYILFIGAYHGERFTSQRVEVDGLLLEKQDNKPNTFRRKGYISVEGSAAIALRYKVKSDVSNQQEVWKSFVDALKPQPEEDYGDDMNADEGEGGSEYSNPIPRKRRGEGALYDHCWEFDDSQLDQLTPQTIKLV